MNTVPKRRNSIRLVAIVVGVLFVAVTVIMASTLGRDRNAAKGIAVDRAAPQFALPALDGGTVRLADLRGKAVIVNFWNEWCIPCRDEHPALKAFYEAHKSDPDFAMVGITRDPNS